jgi:hypothetical protein
VLRIMVKSVVVGNVVVVIAFGPPLLIADDVRCESARVVSPACQDSHELFSPLTHEELEDAAHLVHNRLSHNKSTICMLLVHIQGCYINTHAIWCIFGRRLFSTSSKEIGHFHIFCQWNDNISIDTFNHGWIHLSQLLAFIM